MISFLIVFYACIDTKIRNKKRNETGCEVVYDIIAKHWKYDKKGQFYYWENMDKEKYLQILVSSKRCFSQLSEKEITHLLGKPSTIKHGTWMYCFTDSACKQCTQGCRYYFVMFDKDRYAKEFNETVTKK